MAGRFARFCDDLLVVLAKAAEANPNPSRLLDAREVAIGAGLNWPVGWLRDAARKLEYNEFIRATYSMSSAPDGGVSILSVTGDGFDRVDEILETRGPDEAADESSGAVPAADRMVMLDHNAPNYTQAKTALGRVLENVRSNNEYAVADAAGFSRCVAELESGIRLLEALQVRVEAATALLFPVLRWLARRFADHAAGRLAMTALTELAALLGVSL